MRALVLAASLALLAACGAGPSASGPSVELSSAWPATAGDYEQVSRAWTRHDALRAPFAGHKTLLLDVYATFRAPAWRAAYVDFVADARALSAAARDQLLAEQRDAHEQHFEVTLVVSTHHREHNDLQKGERSMWRVALVGPGGEELPAISIERDRRPREVLAAELPWLGDFAEVYVARFPRSVPLLDGERFQLVLGSQLGSVELTWSES